ncbi:hypothetical protein CTAYLR_010630 [Chrysophaeum taylorii]|uniref:Prolyl 4-hydroxylase alpha subunit domain-containing protein n=1 Tax=Chrysophaeum taylorii TaxID=2483200 RepID=A0AAD7XLQ1_9STRA|nr:hypothetical protein CTAYLR_010630 [Chrysophaeum taylorii]
MGLFSRVVRQEREAPREGVVIEDCLECRVLGSATCFGVAAYSLRQIRVQPAQQTWFVAFGSAWIVLGCAACVMTTVAPLHWVVTREPGRDVPDLPVFAAPAAAVTLGEDPSPSREVVDPSMGVFVLHNVLTASECEAIVATSEAMGYTEDAPVSLGRNVRQNENCVWIVAPATNDKIFERARPLLPPRIEFPRLTLEPVVGLNRRWRLYKYSESDVFKVHADGAWTGSGLDTNGNLVADIYDGTCFSWLTFLIYLNDDFEGGTTSFFKRQEGGDVAAAVFAVKPRRGSVLCFFHGHHPLSPLHQGDIVTSGVKYVARTDVLYKLPPPNLLE